MPDTTAHQPSLTVTITVGSDGRLYFHELTPELLEVAAALCPQDRALLRRMPHEQGGIATSSQACPGPTAGVFAE